MKAHATVNFSILAQIINTVNIYVVAFVPLNSCFSLEYNLSPISSQHFLGNEVIIAYFSTSARLLILKCYQSLALSDLHTIFSFTNLSLQYFSASLRNYLFSMYKREQLSIWLLTANLNISSHHASKKYISLTLTHPELQYS